MNEKRSIGATNKQKGSDAERFYAKIFREMGFDKCVTSRYGSRIHDDAAIDLINLPFNLQIKAGKQKALVPSNVLIDMSERIIQKFPLSYPEHNQPNVVLHKKEVVRGKKRTEFDEIVTMTFKDFKKLIEKIKWE